MEGNISAYNQKQVNQLITYCFNKFKLSSDEIQANQITFCEYLKAYYDKITQMDQLLNDIKVKYNIYDIKIQRCTSGQEIWIKKDVNSKFVIIYADHWEREYNINMLKKYSKNGELFSQFVRFMEEFRKILEHDFISITIGEKYANRNNEETPLKTFKFIFDDCIVLINTKSITLTMGTSSVTIDDENLINQIYTTYFDRMYVNYEKCYDWIFKSVDTIRLNDKFSKITGINNNNYKPSQSFKDEVNLSASDELWHSLISGLIDSYRIGILREYELATEIKDNNNSGESPVKKTRDENITIKGRVKNYLFTYLPKLGIDIKNFKEVLEFFDRINLSKPEEGYTDTIADYIAKQIVINYLIIDLENYEDEKSKIIDIIANAYADARVNGKKIPTQTPIDEFMKKLIIEKNEFDEENNHKRGR